MSFGGRGGGGGGMGGGRGRGGGRGGGRGLGPSGFCQCPKCGRNISHQPRVPCNQMICPECGIRMMRQGINLISSGPMQNKQNIPPIVDKDKCNGCGECEIRCPNGAITIQDNKAVINLIKCKNCRICENSCPVNAIH